MSMGLLPPVVAELIMDIKDFRAGAEEAETKMGGLASSGGAMFDKIGKATVLGVAGIGIASIKMASDFETQMTRLYTAAGAPKAAVKAATGEVLKLGDAVGETGTAMAEALYHPVSAGLDLKTSLAAVKNSAIEAQISGASLDDTTYALSSVMKAFNQDASHAHDTMALLNSIVGQGDMRFQDFNVSVKNWAPTAAQMGISIQSMGAALAYLTDRGNSAEEAATRVTMGLTMMAYPSQKAGKMLQGLGVDTADVTASSQAFTSVMQKTGITQNQLASDLQKPDGIYVALNHLKTALNQAGVSGTEADSIMSHIFGGGKSDKAILSLMQNLDGLQTKFTDIGKGAGQFDQAWSDTQQTFSFKMKKLGAEVENVGIAIGTKLIPPVEAGVGWFARHKAAAEALAAVIGGLLVVATLKWVSSLTGNLFAAIAKSVVAIKGLGAASEAAAEKQAAAKVAAESWGRTLGSAIPIIGGVIVGAAALGNWLSHLGEKSTDATAALNTMSNALLDVAGGSQQANGELGRMAQEAMKLGGNFGAPFFDAIDKGLANLVSSGHLDQAQQALADIDAKLTAGGQSAAKFNSKLNDFNDAVGTYNLQQREAALGADKNSEAAKANSDALGAEGSAMKDAAAAASGLTDSLNATSDAFSLLSGNINSSGFLHEFQKDLLSVKDQLDQNGKAFNDNTLDGLKNEEAFRQAAQAIINYRDSQIKNGVATADANKTAADQAGQLINVYDKLTGNKKAVDAYAKSLGLVPTKLTTDVAIPNLSTLQAQLDAYAAQLADINGGTYHPYSIKNVKHAAGGLITGPGSGTSDDIPAMLSNREYVLKASAVERLGVPFLDALNSGAVPSAPPASSGSGGGQGAVPVINVYLDGQVVPGAVRTQTLRYDQRNSGNGLALAGGGFR